ncbi:MAG TPA: GntR family transcriptional regulator [Mycobacteriales bacterium]|jgi:DNA-binding GntR family transcriptional regulator|nr:GntR family transcriptional regulator [Mycobacteriales bacterium]
MTGSARSSDEPGHATANGPVKAPTKRDRIAAELRRMIAEGELARGSRIQQDVLAAMFHTSITPVREALRLLEAEGVLVGEPHRGVRVADADYEQVKTVYLTRRLLEPYAMRRAARRLSPRDLDVAERLAGEMEQAVAAGDRAALNGANHRFHFLFYSRCGNDGLAADISVLWQAFPWDVLQVLDVRAGDTAAEHREILAAARAADGDALAQATERHIARSFLELARYMTGQEVLDPFDVDND